MNKTIKVSDGIRADENFDFDPRIKRNYTKKEKILNFFYYYKWWLVLGIVIAVILCQIIAGALGIGTVQPDYRIACITSAGLSEDVQSEIENAFAELGEDLNGDGMVKVEMEQYLTGSEIDPENAAYYGYASEVKLQADIIKCDSFVFIMEDPADVQRRYQILADGAGSLPENNDYEAEGRFFPCDSFPALTDMDLTEEAKDALSKLYIGRRGYSDTSKVKYLEQNNEFWEKLIKSS